MLCEQVTLIMFDLVNPIDIGSQVSNLFLVKLFLHLIIFNLKQSIKNLNCDWPTSVAATALRACG